MLSTTDYGESDRIVSLFTLEHGRLRGFARAARNSRKRFGPALETFARVEVMLQHKEGLSSLRSADVISLYTGIRADLPAIAHAAYCCELIESMTPEGVALPRLYRLQAAYLERLNLAGSSEIDRRMLEINLLNILGYRPSLSCCSRCAEPYDSRGALMQHDGELVCRMCASLGRPFSPQALQLLFECLSTGRFGILSAGRDDLLSVAALLDGSLAAHVSQKLKSLDFLRQVSQCGS